MYAILIYAEVPRTEWRAQCLLAPNTRQVANTLAWQERVGIDREALRARLREWEADERAQQRVKRQARERQRNLRAFKI